MPKYNKTTPDYPVETNIDRTEFEDRLNGFYSGKPTARNDSLSIGVTDQVVAERNEALLDALGDLENLPDIQVQFVTALPSEVECEKIYDEVKLTPYDKALTLFRAANDHLEGLEPDTAEYHAAMGELATAQGKWKLENERAVDEVWRGFRRIDEWRSGEGREERNSERRVREAPNADLSDLTPEQREEHKRVQNTDNAWIRRKKENGWSNEQIADEMVKRQAKRLKKSSGN